MTTTVLGASGAAPVRGPTSFAAIAITAPASGAPPSRRVILPDSEPGAAGGWAIRGPGAAGLAADVVGGGGPLAPCWRASFHTATTATTATRPAITTRRTRAVITQHEHRA